MTRDEFLKLMRFPAEWDTLGMYPQELAQLQIGRYEPGHERGSEHDRNGAFHWWLRQGPTKRQVACLRQLAGLDPDPLLGQDMREHFALTGHILQEIRELPDGAQARINVGS